MNKPLTTPEIKDILASKLKDEGTYFTKKHIKLTRIKNGYRIIIDDYTHRPFTLKMEQDEYFSYLTTVYCDTELIYFHDSKYDYDEFHALLNIGYYAGTRF